MTHLMYDILLHLLGSSCCDSQAGQQRILVCHGRLEIQLKF
jgi:hypothetical protein